MESNQNDETPTVRIPAFHGGDRVSAPTPDGLIEFFIDRFQDAGLRPCGRRGAGVPFYALRADGYRRKLADLTLVWSSRGGK